MILNQVCMNLKFFCRNWNVGIWVRKLVEDQAVYQNTKSPYINWKPVVSTTEDLWSDVSLSATDTDTLFTLRKNLGKTKISYYRVAKTSALVDQNILWFYVSVYNLLPV